MALLYDAELTPSKPELLASWVPRQVWFVGDAEARPRIVGSYRFDDPEGEVGIETFLVRFGGGPTLQVPWTYRNAPLASSAEDGPAPITTMEHSVLGRRWVYDGPEDPVYLATLASIVQSGGKEARLLTTDGTELPSRGRVRGSGTGATATANGSGTGAAAMANGAQTGAAPTANGLHEAAVDVAATVVTTPDFVLRLRRAIEPLDPADVADPHLSGTWSESHTPTVLAILEPGGG